MQANWKYIGTAIDGENFEINGLNIWDYEWKSVNEKVIVKDPLYNNSHTIDVYEIEADGLQIKFAAGEFSNLVWGIYKCK